MRDLTVTDFAVAEVVADPATARNGVVIGRTRSGVRVEWDAVGGGSEAPTIVSPTLIEKPQGRAAYLVQIEERA